MGKNLKILPSQIIPCVCAQTYVLFFLLWELFVQKTWLRYLLIDYRVLKSRHSWLVYELCCIIKFNWIERVEYPVTFYLESSIPQKKCLSDKFTINLLIFNIITLFFWTYIMQKEPFILNFIIFTTIKRAQIQSST